ncbi:hypothetical protein [Nocardia jejuensis]|uniref:hypothetical protein n=1 Tax=Nocardia jejuensis TaxID=328049 RepID=UPI00082F5C74
MRYTMWRTVLRLLPTLLVVLAGVALATILLLPGYQLYTEFGLSWARERMSAIVVACTAFGEAVDRRVEDAPVALWLWLNTDEKHSVGAVLLNT